MTGDLWVSGDTMPLSQWERRRIFQRILWRFWPRWEPSPHAYKYKSGYKVQKEHVQLDWKRKRKAAGGCQVVSAKWGNWYVCGSRVMKGMMLPMCEGHAALFKQKHVAAVWRPTSEENFELLDRFHTAVDFEESRAAMGLMAHFQYPALCPWSLRQLPAIVLDYWRSDGWERQ